MKYNLIIILTTLIAFNLPSIVNAQTNVSGTLTTDTEWTADGSPYNITAALGVASGVTLTINSGVTVQGNVDVLVKGQINIDGSTGDSVTFNQTRLIFKDTDLSNSSIQYLKLVNNSKLQLSDNNSDNNSNTLIVTHLLLKNSGLVTKGYDSNASLDIYNARVLEGTIQGDYPRSETIRLYDSKVENSSIFSYAYNEGVFLENSHISNTYFASGCCGSNININECIVLNSSFEQANDSQPGSSNGLNISNSSLTNTAINMPVSTVNLSESIVVYNIDYSESYCFISGNGRVENTSFTGYGDLIAIERGPSFYNYDNKSAYDIIGSSFESFEVSIKINDGTQATSGNGPVLINQCNFLQSSQYHLMNSSIYNVNATQNYWGTTDESIIANLIFDGLDDINSGIVDFSSYLSSPTADVPISTPGNVYKGLQGDGIYMSWDANLETNLAGYKIFNKSNGSDDYSLLADVGNVTSYFTDQISIADYIVIKAYTSEADGLNDFLEGNESDFSNSAKGYISDISLSSSNLCGNQALEVSLSSEYSLTDNEFILQLSNINENFADAVNLDSISNSSETLSSLLPDTLQIEETYLVRVFSTELSVFSESFEVIPYSIPSSTFESENLICSSDTATVTYTGDASTDASYTWDFDGATIISGSGQGPYELFWSTEGAKSIRLEVSENGCASTSENQVEVLQTPTSYFSVQTQLCDGDSAFILYTGNASDTATYTWDFDGGFILSGEGAGPYEVNWDSLGSKTISLSVSENGCSSESFAQQINYNQHPSLSFTGNQSTCYNENYEITFTGSNFTDLDWNFDGANVISGSESGPYVLNWSSSGAKFINLVASNNGCSKDSTIVVEIPERPYTPDICLVTVDEASSKNMLVWGYDIEFVNQFGIYRETNVSGEYSLIEYVDGGLSNSYIDTQSSPGQQSNRYKITSLDSCGTETELSSYHKTIHLTINQGIGNSWNLIWDGYEGFSFGTYRIYRSLDGNSFELLTEIASNLTSFTDTDVPSSDVGYQIEVITSNSCTANEGGRISQNSLSRSNIARNSNVLGTSSVGISIVVYPNPASDYLKINSSFDQLDSFELLTLTGQIVQVGELIGQESISLKDISSGIYLLKINSNHGSTTKRIVKK